MRSAASEPTTVTTMPPLTRRPDRRPAPLPVPPAGPCPIRPPASIDVDAERDARSRQRRVGAQHALDDRERLVVFRQPPPVARGLRALLGARSSSNAIRSGGRHARCHASAASSAPPAKNAERHRSDEQRERRRHATPTADAAPHAIRSARTEDERDVREGQTGGGAGEQTDGGNRGDVRARARRCKRRHRARSRGTKDTKDTKAQSLKGFVPSCPSCPSWRSALRVAESARASRPSRRQFLRSSPAARGRRAPCSRSARIALTAAAAPVSVVMHGTSCIIAARRTARSSKNDSRPSGVLMTRSTLRLTISSAMFGRPSFTL